MQASSFAALRAFDATARLGSMTAAARALGLRQPTVSAHIADLEASYGVELFLRRRRRVELTDFGMRLREVTNRIFRSAEDAVSLLEASNAQPHGRLTLCAVGPYNVVPLLQKFRESLPHVSLVVRVGDSRQIVDQILDYRGDIGVLVHRLDDSRVHSVPLRPQRLLVFASARHPLAGKKRLWLHDLEQQSFVMREEGSTTRQVFLEALGRAGISIRSSIEMGSREAVHEAVAQGMGLGIVGERAFLSDARVVALDILDLDMQTHPHVICLEDRRHLPLVARFLQIATGGT